MKPRTSSRITSPLELLLTPLRATADSLGMPIGALRGTVRHAFLAAILALLACAPVQAQTYLIDFGGANTTEFGPAPDDPQFRWNNLRDTIGTSATGALSNLVSSVNSTSTISLLIVSRFNGANENGTQDPTIYPIDATRDSLYGNTEVWNGVTNIFPSFKLVGLDLNTTYDFSFYASRTGVSDNRETEYTVAGNTTNVTFLDAANNTEQTALITGIKPDAAGEITISLAPGANNNNAYHFTYLGVLAVTATPPQTPLAFTTQPVSQRVVQLQSATFTSAVSGSPPYSVQWYENGQPLFGQNQFTLTIPSVTLDMNGYAYSVTVSNLAYGVASTNAILTVLSDTNRPVLVKATSYDGMNIELAFNEPLDFFTVLDTQNYVIDGGAQQVFNIALSPDGQVITLSLSGPVSGTFTIVVNNVKDLAGNAVATNTTATGTVVAIEQQDLLFDFGGNNTTEFGAPPDDPVNRWNNVGTGVSTSDTGEMMNLITAHNAQTTCGLSMISRFNGVNENGTLVSTIFPQKATRDSCFGNTEVFSGLSNIFPSFKLTSLNPARQYSLTFYASRTGVGDIRETAYTVTGANSAVVALNAANNINDTVTAMGISPTPAGEITVSLAPSSRNNNANHFTYLGVLKVSPYVAPPQFLTPVIENGQIRLQWTGTGQLQRAANLTGQWESVLPTPSSPYLDTLVPGQNRFYRIQQ